MERLAAAIQRARAASPTAKLAAAISKARLASRVVHGIKVVIDRPRGFVQRGTDARGVAWERTYQTDYGYIDGTAGGDGEPLDVYVGPNAAATSAFLVSQSKMGSASEFDEYKLFVGYDSPAAARAVYVAHTPAELLMGVHEVPVAILRALLGVEPMDQVAKSFGVARSVALLAHALGAPSSAPRVPVPAPDLLDGTQRVCKALAPGERRLLLGIVLEPDIVDSQGDTYSADEIEKTAHLYMVEFQNIGLQHKGFVNHRVRLVESFIAPAAMSIAGTTISAGTWLMKVRVEDDELWQAVLDGKLTGFSIAGFARRTAV